jgi:hypothetical protein
MEVVSRYGSYLLIGLGWLLFSIIIPSAAGPSDAAPRARLAAPPVTTGGAAPLLIGSPRQAPLPGAPDLPPAATAIPTPLVIATAPAIVVPPTPTAVPALPPSDRIVIPRSKWKIAGL